MTTPDSVTQSLLDLIAPQGDDGALNCLIYGDPGVGKTVLAATAPRPLFFDVENGFRSVSNHPELAEHARRMRFAGVKSAEALATKVLEGTFGDYDTIVIDTLTALQDKALKEWTLAAFKKNPNDSQREGDKYTPIGKDYQRNQEMMKHIVSLFRDSDKHIIFLCHAKDEKDESTGVISKAPMLSPKLAGKVLADCSLVGYMTRTGKTNDTPEKRFLRVQPTTKIIAKSRIGGLPDIIESPTFDMFLRPTHYFSKESNV